MSDFLQSLRDGLNRCGACGGRLLLAVSGGADSVALLRGCLLLSGELDLTVRAAHFDHGLRGAESAADAEWVRTLCSDLSVPVATGRAQPELSAKVSHVEETARRERYRFLGEIAAAENCSGIATAHTADDQAETVLHHVLRGTGLAGLRGIPERRPVGGPGDVPLVRPMLRIRRATVEEWLAGIGQDYRSDPTNADRSFTRNRIRHELLPLLARDYSPGVVDSLLRLGEIATDVEATLETLADDLLSRALVPLEEPAQAALDCRVLSAAPRHLVREALVQLWKRRSWPRQSMGFDHWNRLARMTETPLPDDVPPAMALPGGIDGSRKRDRLTLIRL